MVANITPIIGNSFSVCPSVKKNPGADLSATKRATGDLLVSIRQAFFELFSKLRGIHGLSARRASRGPTSLHLVRALGQGS